MTNFSVAEFGKIWDHLHKFVRSNWIVGRGRRCDRKAKDVLFMTLADMKIVDSGIFLVVFLALKEPRLREWS